MSDYQSITNNDNDQIKVELSADEKTLEIVLERLNDTLENKDDTIIEFLESLTEFQT